MNRGLVTVFMALLLIIAAPRVSGAADDIAQLMEQVNTLTAEKAELPQKFKDNLSLKEAVEKEAEKTAEDRKALDAEYDALKTPPPEIKEKCHGTYSTEAELAAAKAACDAVETPYNKAVTDHKTKSDQNKKDRSAEQKKEKERAAELANLSALDKELPQRIAALQRAILTAKQIDCPCTSQNNDSLAQCEQACWDKALSAGELPGVKSGTGTPVFGGTPARTEQQAIDEYKKSGNASPGPQTLRTNPVP